MFELEPLKPEHFDEIIGQDSQSYFTDIIAKHPDYKKIICNQSVGKTGRLDGVIIGICGITKVTDYLGEGWAYFSPILPKARKSVVKAIREFLNSQKHIRRIQCTVDVYNHKAIRFAKVLGFKPESILQSYGPEGHDHMMFTIIHRNLDWEAK
jgi:RimJ/RimL family protein N-acetyltransferase